jgi:flagellar L-ring protein FlgH
MKTPSRCCFKILSGLSALLLSAAQLSADSLWSPEIRQSQFADTTAHAIGDLITVVVQESNTTRKDSTTKTSKKTSLDASIEAFLYSPAASSFLTKTGPGGGRHLPAMRMGSKTDFDGGGRINNSESIISRFGVRVVDVLPNNNLIVEGLRQTSFSGESQTIILRGTLRPFDITPNNTVFSYNLADVALKFENSGTVSDAQRKGWFTRVWDKVTPF